MYGHTLSASTHTVEMLQVTELNDRIRSIEATAGAGELISAACLDLANVAVAPHLLDRAATSVIPRQVQPDREMPGTALLRLVVAAGAPSFPYLYGLFAETNSPDGQLPAALHTCHLRAISDALGLHRHQWGT
jgi:hypothetical protein